MYQVNPVTDPRWRELLERHPFASVFHTPGWLEALRRTYGFAPIAFTTSAPGQELKNAIVLCAIDSWATGRRLVSLPYSDHCDPLTNDGTEIEDLVAVLKSYCDRQHYKYAEFRPLRSPLQSGSRLQETEKFLFHLLDLTPPADTLFASFDKSCIQQRIRRAAKEDVVYEEGRSEALLSAFYRLLVMTRQRHQLPPQPIEWFRNLITSLGTGVTIHLVTREGQPITSILSIGYKQSLVAKYSCSDEYYKKLGATPLLFWRVIQFGKERGYRELDLGRCNLQDEGLATFKRRLGALTSGLSYWRYNVAPQATRAASSAPRFAKQVFQHLPPGLLIRCGRLLYRHFD